MCFEKLEYDAGVNIIATWDYRMHGSPQKQEYKTIEELNIASETMHEDLNRGLKELSMESIVQVPEENQQTMCCWTKTPLNQGSGEKIYVVQYSYTATYGTLHKLNDDGELVKQKGKVERRLKKVILCEEALQKNLIQIPKYDHMIVGSYDDWDSFIDKTGGVDIKEMEHPWY